MTEQGVIALMGKMRAFWRKQYPASMPEEACRSLMAVWWKGFHECEDNEVLNAVGHFYLEGLDYAPTPKMILAYVRKGRPLEAPEQEMPLIIEYDGGYEGVIMPGLPDYMYAGVASRADIKRAEERWKR